MMSNLPRWEKSCSRLSWRYCTMARMSALICQSSPVWVKYFTSIWIGRPRCTSNWLNTPALAFSSTACERSVPTISIRQPASAGRSPSGTSRSNTAPARSRRPRTRCAGDFRAARACEQRRHDRVAADDRTGSCRGRRTSRWWSSPRPLRRQRARVPPFIFWHQFGDAERARPCAPAASAGSRPDIACRPTDRGRNGPSAACADTRNRAASRRSPENSRTIFGAT